MQKIMVLVSVVLFALTNVRSEPVRADAAPSAPIVYFDVAGPDAAALKRFYAANFGWSIDDANGVTTPGLKGNIRQDPPETLVYLGVSDVNATLKSIAASGGTVVLPRTVVPNVVTFAIFRDPAGNRVGLVEVRR